MTSIDLGPAILFCPADRPERYAKAAERADAVILDLEDAVAAPTKSAAREALRENLLDADRTIVRINPAGTPDHELDIAAVRATPYRTVMLAKTESIDDLKLLDGFAVIALCETARGVIAAPALAGDDRVAGFMWGAEDLTASLGGTSSRGPDGRYRAVASHARASILLHARAHDKVVIDAVHLDIADEAGLAEEARDAAGSGFMATACIHPSQVAIVRAAYAPTEEEIAFAHDVLAAAESERGVFAFRGGMVDEPVLRHARRVLQRATAV